MKIDREKKKRFLACDVDEDTFYISTFDGMLFAGNKKTLEMSFVRCEFGKEMLYSSPAEKIVVSGKYIYMFGCYHKKINVFDMDEKTCTVLLDYQNDMNMNRSIGAYFAIVKNDENVYVFVDNQCGFYKICNGHYKFIEFNIMISNYKWSTENVLAYLDFDSCNVYFYFIDCGNVLCFESETEKWKEYGLQVIIENPVSIQEYEGYLYILTKENSYYKCGLDDNSFSVIMLPDSIKGNDWDHLVVTNKKLFLIPGTNDKIVEIQMEHDDRGICFLDYPIGIKSILADEYKPLLHKFREYSEDKLYRYYSERYYNYLLLINKKTGDVIWNNIAWPEEKQFIEEYANYGKITKEEDCGLKQWLDVVMEIKT